MQKTEASAGREGPASRPGAAAPGAGPKTAGSGGRPATAPSKEPAEQGVKQPSHLILRRRMAWGAVCAFLGSGLLMFLRFFFPRTLFEPSSRFRIGAPADYGLGVDERYKQLHRIWVVRQPDKMFVIFAKCTHLGCTPNWIESENKFKCPCHGSGYDIEGRNFEGPAPRPMDRAFVELDAEGQIVVDTSRLFSCPPGAPCQFGGQSSYLVV